jgi:hypothetical protein
MARQVAFAMQLPSLSEEQEGRVRRYGKEHCEEMRITKRGATTDVAGILIHPFSNKKVAQTSLGINLKAWKITKPKYVRGWYRELSLDEYFAEFREGQSVLGRRLQTLVSSTVAHLLQHGTAKVKKIHDNHQRAVQLLAAILERRRKACFDTLVDPIRQRHREREAMCREDADARLIAREKAREQKDKAALELRARLACPVYQKQLQTEKVEREIEAQRISVANHWERQLLKRKRGHQ